MWWRSVNILEEFLRFCSSVGKDAGLLRFDAVLMGYLDPSISKEQHCNKELMQLFGDLDIFSFIRISHLNWIGHVKRMGNKRKVSQVFKNNPVGSRLRGWPENRWWKCAQMYIHKSKIKNWKERSRNRSDWEKSTKEVKISIGLYCHLRRRRRDFKETMAPSSRFNILGPNNLSQHDGSIFLQNFRNQLPIIQHHIPEECNP